MIVLAIHPRGALLLDAATFLISAILVRTGVRHRPPAISGTGRGVTGAAADMRAGVRYVFSNRTLRAYLALMWSSCLFVYAFEGQVASLTRELHAGSRLGGILIRPIPRLDDLGDERGVGLVPSEYRFRI